MTLAPWHTLLAPLPADARVEQRPVLTAPPPAGDDAPGQTAAADSIRGWTQRVVQLSAGTAGLRVVMLALDAAGRPIAFSDMVYQTAAGFCADVDESTHAEPDDDESRRAVIARADSIGGSLDADGTFLGTRWRGAERRAPSDAEIAAVHALVAELLSRPVWIAP